MTENKPPPPIGEHLTFVAACMSDLIDRHWAFYDASLPPPAGEERVNIFASSAVVLERAEPFISGLALVPLISASYKPGFRIVGVVVPDEGGPLLSPTECRTVLVGNILAHGMVDSGD